MKSENGRDNPEKRQPCLSDDYKLLRLRIQEDARRKVLLKIVNFIYFLLIKFHGKKSSKYAEKFQNSLPKMIYQVNDKKERKRVLGATAVSKTLEIVPKKIQA